MRRPTPKEQLFGVEEGLRVPVATLVQESALSGVGWTVQLAITHWGSSSSVQGSEGAPGSSSRRLSLGKEIYIPARVDLVIKSKWVRPSGLN